MENEKKSKYRCEACGKDAYLTREEFASADIILCDECKKAQAGSSSLFSSEEIDKIAHTALRVTDEALQKVENSIKAKQEEKENQQKTLKIGKFKFSVQHEEKK